MSAEDFNRCTLREYIIRANAYRKRINADIKLKRELNRERWRQARLIAYCVAKPYFEKGKEQTTPFQFYPLPGDPTEKQQAKAAKKELSKAMDYATAVQEAYRKMKII